jgi:benzoylformate decarboxylase
MTGIDVFLDVLADCGVRYIFGNPGTSELPLNDALVNDRRFQYILGLQEVPVMAMADGYAMASGHLGVVNLHISCGLGNAMGILYNAYREGTPLLVTAGQQDRRLSFEEPILYGDMVAVARPWTKWAHEVARVEDLPVAVRRAVQTARTPPTGPVFLSLPMDVQMEPIGSYRREPFYLPDSRVRPPIEAMRRAVDVLLSAANPVILAGSRVTERDAMRELVSVAEVLGAPVVSEPGTTHGRLAFPSDHPLHDGGLPLWSPEVRLRLERFDVALVVGMDLLRQYVYHEPSRAIPESLRIVHLDEDPWQLGKNYPTEVGLIGDSKAGLDELHRELVVRMTPAHVELARQRFDRHAARHSAERDALHRQVRAEIEKHADRAPLSSLALMGAVADALPPDVAIVEEAVTTTNTTFQRLGILKNTTGYFGHRGWTLGWGLGVTIGAKLAWPDRPVIGLIGEGSAMYGIQALWSAARYRIPAIFVICNNAQYRILKVGARGLNLPQARNLQFEGLDLTNPEIDFPLLARAMGVDSLRASTPAELTEMLRAAISRDCPILIDAPVERGTPERLNYG